MLLAPARTRVLLAILFTFAGVLHLVQPGRFLAIMPPSLPVPGLLVALSGIAEILGGLGLLVPGTRRVAGWGLILLLIAVFPANVQMLINYRALGVGWWGEALLWARLPIQMVLIWGVYRGIAHQSTSDSDR